MTCLRKPAGVGPRMNIQPPSDLPSLHHDSWDRLSRYAFRTGRTLTTQLGWGGEGVVYATEARTAIKSYRHARSPPRVLHVPVVRHSVERPQARKCLIPGRHRRVSRSWHEHSLLVSAHKKTHQQRLVGSGILNQLRFLAAFRSPVSCEDRPGPPWLVWRSLPSGPAHGRETAKCTNRPAYSARTG